MIEVGSNRLGPKFTSARCRSNRRLWAVHYAWLLKPGKSGATLSGEGGVDASMTGYLAGVFGELGDNFDPTATKSFYGA
jgi:hypothetical protein